MKKLVAIAILFIMACGSGKQVVRETAVRESTAPAELVKIKKEILNAPGAPEPFYKMGMYYLGVDSALSAIAYFDSALYFDPGYTAAQLERATARIALGDFMSGYDEYLTILKSERGDEYAADIAKRTGQPHPIVQLTAGEYNNAYATYSPVGDVIAFQSDRTLNWDLYVMDENGSRDSSITDHPEHDEMPVFSPNGEFITFTSTRDDTGKEDRVDTYRNIYLLDLQNDIEARVTEYAGDDWYPAFTNKDNEILFVSEKDDPRDVEFQDRWSDIYRKNLKDGSVIRLTQNQADDGTPAVTRDGKWILFSSNRDGMYQIYRMNRKGNVIERLTFIDGNCSAPHISHDGRKIVFSAEVNGNYDIYMMQISGKKLMRMTCDPAQDGYPCFSPDGTRIIFHSNRRGKFQIFWIDLLNTPSQVEVVRLLEDRMTSLKE